MLAGSHERIGAALGAHRDIQGLLAFLARILIQVVGPFRPLTKDLGNRVSSARDVIVVALVVGDSVDLDLNCPPPGLTPEANGSAFHR